MTARLPSCRSAALARARVRFRRIPSRRRWWPRRRWCRGRARRTAGPLAGPRRIADAAQRAQGEQALVLQAHLAARAGVDVLAADGAGGARRRATRWAAFSSSPDSAAASSNVPCWKLRVGRAAQAVERQQVGDGAQLAILRRRRAERAAGQILGRRHDARRIGDLDACSRPPPSPLSSSSPSPPRVRRGRHGDCRG